MTRLERTRNAQVDQPSPFAYQRYPNATCATPHGVAPVGSGPIGTFTEVLVPLHKHRREEKLIRALSQHRFIFTAPEHYSSPTEESDLLQLAASQGLPTIGRVSREARSIIGDALSNVIEGATVEATAHPDTRDRLSVRMRRHSRTASSTLGISVSVVLCTNRPEFLRHAIGQVSRQRHPSLELIVVAHGEGFPSDAEIKNETNTPIEVVRCDQSVIFGDALNAGTAAASGQLVTKLDDDDWYGPDHILDLLHAHQVSGSPLVAKGAEFVYLGEIDVTIRRLTDGSDTYQNRNVAGGTLMFERTTIQQLGGWRSVEKHVDQALLDDLELNRIPWYRTHGFGYVLHRRRSGHTWDASIDYFLDLATSQYRGLPRSLSLTHA